MSEELEIFLEDCDDQLQMMEDALVDMQNSGATEDSIGAIFRAAHTIKGSAGMFGFDEIVAFTHIVENLFEHIREGAIEVTTDMVDLFLLCKDHIDKLIAVQTDEQELDDVQKAVGDDLIKKLTSYMSSEGNQEKETQDAELIEEELDVSNDANEITTQWHISVRFKKDFFTTGMNIYSIFNFFNKIGKILINHPILYNIPLLKDINPLHPYIGFELLLQADISKEEIEEIFEFVKDDVDLIIFKKDEKDGANLLVIKRQETQLQNTLIDAGFYTKENFEEVPKQEEAPKQEESDKKSVKIDRPVTKTSQVATPKTIKKDETKKKPSSSLRVDSNKIDLLINYMSEIVIANSKILTLVEQEDNTELEEASSRMKELLESVRDGIMDMRMVQVGESFNKFRRIVNDTSKKIGKDVEFVITGGETELDKTVVEKISDPLVHMLRNSIDHGVEMPQERVDKGKTSKGRVDLRAYPDSGTMVIEIEDDGKGLDKERILAKAIETGQVSENANLSDAEIYKLIFAAGLSTAQKVSNISGRGVGMDVVRRNIEDLRGTIDIDSAINKGSKITVRLPLTLAIIDGFLVQIGNTKYIIPLESIQECIELTKKEQDSMHGNEFINLRGEMLPILDLRAVLNETSSISRRENIVIVYFGNKMIGLLVDELLGEYQTVIKPLGSVFANVPGISGGSILGSGEIALIFDIARLIEYRI
jgi:two-component system chemotaxis sensor kinase CheA